MAIGRFLSINKSLTALFLDYNQISNKGIATIGLGLTNTRQPHERLINLSINLRKYPSSHPINFISLGFDSLERFI